MFSYLVKWRSLVSMLRCLIHMRVSADPMSLVAPTGDINGEKTVRTSLKLHTGNTSMAKTSMVKTTAELQNVVSCTLITSILKTI